MKSLDVEIRIKPRGRISREPIAPARPRIPRIARLMALAIRFEQMLEEGEVRDFAELARLGYVSRARLTQIMNLTLLAPDLQQTLLEHVEHDVPERDIRRVLTHVDWATQRAAFRKHLV